MRDDPRGQPAAVPGRVLKDVPKSKRTDGQSRKVAAASARGGGSPRPTGIDAGAAVDVSSPAEAATLPLRALWPGALLTAGVAFVIYLATLQRSLPTGDSGELLAAAWSLGVAHPPGYPLYTLLGFIVTHLSFGNPALAMNLLSAALDAAAVGVVFILIARLNWALAGDQGSEANHGNRRLSLVVAGTASLSLAVSPQFWSYSLVAEVFALNNLLAALLLALAIDFRMRPDRTSRLYLVGLLSGLGFAHQQTIVTFFPAIAILVANGLWRRSARRSPGRPGSSHNVRVVVRPVLVAAGCVVVGLLPYAYLPLAASGQPGGQLGRSAHARELRGRRDTCFVWNVRARIAIAERVDRGEHVRLRFVSR